MNKRVTEALEDLTVAGEATLTEEEDDLLIGSFKSTFDFSLSFLYALFCTVTLMK